MNEKTIYGHRGLFGAFDPIASVDDSGFLFKGKHYRWTDITKIKRYDSMFWSLFFYQAGAPVAYIYLNDGRRVRIRGRLLETEHERTRVDFLKGTTQAYEKLMEFIATKTKGLSNYCVQPIAEKTGSG
jgi:hypothetical protein